MSSLNDRNFSMPCCMPCCILSSDVSSNPNISMPCAWHHVIVLVFGDPTSMWMTLKTGRSTSDTSSTTRSNCHASKSSVPSHLIFLPTSSLCKVRQVRRNSFFCLLQSGPVWCGSRGASSPTAGHGTHNPSNLSAPKWSMIRFTSSKTRSDRWQSSDRRATINNSDRGGGGGRFASGESAGTSFSSGWRTCLTAPSAPLSTTTSR